jgi:hypothetical protein
VVATRLAVEEVQIQEEQMRLLLLQMYQKALPNRIRCLLKIKIRRSNK